MAKCVACLKREARPDRLWTDVTVLCRPCMISAYRALTKHDQPDGSFPFDALITWATAWARKKAVPRG